MEIAVLLHNVRSAHNVGSIFRTADAAGVSRVFLSGYTPRPLDRFDRPQPEIAKTALGAEKQISWEYAKLPKVFLVRLRRDGWQIVGVEQDDRSENYTLRRPNRRTVFIFGNEVHGLSKKLRDACDMLIEIPMKGKKESLNVAVAAGVVLIHAANNQ